MIRILIATLLSACLALAADKKAEVQAAEKGWATATVKADRAALEQLLAEDLAYTHSNGETDSKKVYIDNLFNGVRKYVQIDHENMETRLYGNVAVLSATAKVTTQAKGAQPGANHLRFIHVWVSQKGKWQLVAHQSLRLPN